MLSPEIPGLKAPLGFHLNLAGYLNYLFGRALLVGGMPTKRLTTLLVTKEENDGGLILVRIFAKVPFPLPRPRPRPPVTYDNRCFAKKKLSFGECYGGCCTTG